MKYSKLTRVAAILMSALLLCLTLASCSDTGMDGDLQGGEEQGTESATIVKTELINGNLIVTYSDGRVENLGPLSGESDSDSLSFYPLPDGTYGITAGNTIYLEGISVPETYKGRAVTRILNDAFKGMKNLKSITLPEGIVSIGASAFAECESLEAVTIPESVTDIGASAFYGCKRIESVTVPAEVKSLGSQSFYNCEALSEITLPETDIAIGGSAFYGTAYYINEENWQNGALYLNRHLIEVNTASDGKYAIADGTFTVANYAFARCDTIVEVTVPDSVASIGDSAFAGLELLREVRFGDASSLVRIGEKAFMSCSALERFSLPCTVTEISPMAFSDCVKLTEIRIDGEASVLTLIGEEAFMGCVELVSISLPNKLEKIEQSAFEGCVKLESVALDPKECGLKSIGDRAFFGCSALKEIFIPVSVTEIGDYAFAECVGVGKVEYGSVEEDWKKLVSKGNDWDENIPVDKMTFAKPEVTPEKDNNN